MFLEGAGGSMLAIPVLSSLLPREARAQAVSRPKYIQVVSSESAKKESADPNVGVGTYRSLGSDATAAPLSEIITKSGRISAVYGTAFNPFASKMNLITNTICHTANTNHNESIPTTGGGVVKKATEDLRDPVNKFSVDYRLQQVIYGSQTPALKAIRMTLDPKTYLGTFCYDGNRGGMADKVTSIEGLRNRLGLVLNSSSQTTTNTSRRDLFSAVLADYQKTANSRQISASDKKLLEAAMQRVAEIRDTSTPTSTSVTCGLPAQSGTNDFFGRHKQAIDILVAALSCGVTDIVAYTILQGEDSVFNRSSIHDAHHRGSGTDMDNFMRWRMKILAYFLQKMESTEMPSGKSLLDESLLYYGTEYATVGTVHKTQGFTSLLAGGAGGRMITGQHIDAGQAPLGRVLITIMKAFGLSTSQIEGSSGIVGFGEYAAAAGTVVYPQTAKFFANAEKRLHLPILR